MLEAKTVPGAERQEYYGRIAQKSLAPLWERLRGLVIKEPRPRAVPVLWRWAEVGPIVMESGGLITAEEAERRVIILENPGLPGTSQVTGSLYAGLQLILPGEVAPSHRHTQSALRFIVEGEGAFTAVDGEKTVMKEGDFVITPSWTWHDHGNESDRPMVWMDGLDIPIIALFDAQFAEHFPEKAQPLSRPEGDALARYGSGLLPVDWKPETKTSPVFNYPYERTRAALDRMHRRGEWDPFHGLKLRYVNPASGDWAMPTIATFMQLLPNGFAGAPYRSTDGAVFSVVEGRGRTRIGDRTVFEWGPKDSFVVPSWTWYRHESDGDAVLFSFSDRSAQEKLGLFREQRGDA
jgi:gentisate 1,2-dioxygenase